MSHDPVNPVTPGTVPPRGATLAPLRFEWVPLIPVGEVVRDDNSESSWLAFDRATEEIDRLFSMG